MKNFKLLLATTAILSTGALAVFAETSFESNPSTEFTAQVQIFEPTTLSGGGIDFGGIVVGEGRTLKILPNGEIDPSSDVVINKTTLRPSITYLTVRGGLATRLMKQLISERDGYKSIVDEGVGGESEYTAEYIESAQEDLTYLNDLLTNGVTSEYYGNSVAISFSNSKIELFDTSNTSDKCGEVTALTRGDRASSDCSGNICQINIGYGGTFTMAEDYHPADGYASCFGSITATLVLPNLY